ncbi:MAG: YkgJ family cysteine cluster protein [Ruminiclostridium sp.]|nr:YkgJ family cysteine cluster protein [Ruminiclostridium sp.]
MLGLAELEKKYKKVEDENWAFRGFLKSLEPEGLDKFVNDMHIELFKNIDCIKCSNCCKKIVPTLNAKDIRRLAKHFNISFDDFASQNVEKSDGEWILKEKSCKFLTESGCSVYDVRPESCREYPYTDKKGFVHRLIGLIEYSGVCPVVYEIFERLKRIYRIEFEDYKKFEWDLF